MKNNICKENIEKALIIIDEMEEHFEDDDYDVLADARKLNELIPGMVYGKSTDHIRYICNELLEGVMA